MKFLLFADLHYMPKYYKTFGWDALRTFWKRAEETGCDMIIHAGDSCHPTETPDFVKAYNEFHIPSYHCLGNHDTDHCAFEEAIKLYNMPNDYYYFDMGGYRFIVTDTSYFFDGEKYVPYANENYYDYPKTRETMPPEEIEWLKQTIDESKFPCIIISHASFERCNGLKNRDAVREVIDNANKKKPHSVLMCINGHHHRENIRLLNNVIYYEMNGASYDWIGATPHDSYPEEETKNYDYMRHTICFNDPLHAIITLEGTTVTIEGMESSMYMGVTRKTLGLAEYDAAGRAVTASVTSEKITIG